MNQGWRCFVRPLALVSGLTLLLAGCSGSAEDAWHTVDATTVGLGDTVAVLYVSPQIDDFSEPGYVVLVQADGSYTSVQTAGMDVGQVT